MNRFAKLLREVEELRCQICGGLGTINDADLGDIFYNEEKCTHCEGSGIKDGQDIVLTKPL